MSAADGREHTPLFYHPALFETANVKMTRLYTYIVEMGGESDKLFKQLDANQRTNTHFSEEPHFKP